MSFVKRHDHLIMVLGVVLLVSLATTPVISQTSEEDIYRKQPSRQFKGPVSFFFAHGYVTAAYQSFDGGFNTAENGLTGPPGNTTLANTSDPTFFQDVGLILGAEINNQIKLMTEQHWINDNSGGGNDNSDLVFVQANVQWQPFPDKPYRLKAGRFWSGFANTQDDLLSAQNEFQTTPNARSILPFAFQEGVQVDGAHKMSDGDVGVNWLVEVGNGNNTLPADTTTGSPGRQFDTNDNKDVLARVGVLPLEIISEKDWDHFEIGANYIDGTLSDRTNSHSEYDGWALDFNWETEKYRLRSYYAEIENDTKAGAGLSEQTLDREGLLVEGRYEVVDDIPVLGTMDVKARYDEFTRDDDASTTLGDERISYGLQFQPHEQLALDAEYHDSDEVEDSADVDDDGVTVSMTASF